MLFLGKERKYQIALYSLDKIENESQTDFPYRLRTALAVYAEVGPYVTKDQQILNLCKWDPTDVFKLVAEKMLGYIPSEIYSKEVAQTILTGVKINYPDEDYLDEIDLILFIKRSRAWINRFVKRQKQFSKN